MLMDIEVIGVKPDAEEGELILTYANSGIFCFDANWFLCQLCTLLTNMDNPNCLVTIN